MAVAMTNQTFSQIQHELDFTPRLSWPDVLPAFSWRGLRIAGFTSPQAKVVELDARHSLVEVLLACYPKLGLSELSRLSVRLEKVLPDYWVEVRSHLFASYGLHWNERLAQTTAALARAPRVFQETVDEKSMQARDLAPLLALNNAAAFNPFLEALSQLKLTKTELARTLELGVELFLLGRSLSDILPSSDDGPAYLRRLEKWRTPVSSETDETWSGEVERWPWPAQVRGQWRRSGDQSGLDVQIRASSPSDLRLKLEKLLKIPERWSHKI